MIPICTRSVTVSMTVYEDHECGYNHSVGVLSHCNEEVELPSRGTNGEQESRKTEARCIVWGQFDSDELSVIGRKIGLESP